MNYDYYGGIRDGCVSLFCMEDTVFVCMEPGVLVYVYQPLILKSVILLGVFFRGILSLPICV